MRSFAMRVLLVLLICLPAEHWQRSLTAASQDPLTTGAPLVGSGADSGLPPPAPAAQVISYDDMTLFFRLVFLIGSALVLLVVSALLLGRSFNWLIMGEDNRYSNSKFQMALWFGALISAYLATVVVRIYDHGLSFAGGVDVPKSLLALSGMSALSFAGAKQIVVSKIDQRGGDASAVKPASLRAARFPTDLVTDDSGHRPDFGDFQMLIVTLLAVGVWLTSYLHFLGHLPITASVTLPDVDSTILGTFGIGQGAYLAKKFAGDTSPTVFGPTIRGNPPRPLQGRPLPANPDDQGEDQ